MFEVKYVEKDPEGNPTGRKVVMHGRELAPLGYEDLVNRILDRASPIAVKLLGAEVIESSLEMPKGRAAFIETIVETELTARHISLVRGGWLPAGLTLKSGSLIMPDRCTLSELRGRFKPGGKAKVGRDFVDWLDTPDVRINPVLLAIEGNQREFPSRADIETQMTEHIRQFRTLLPNATIIGDAPEVMDAITRFAEQQRAASERTIQFLLAAARRLRHQVSRDRLDSVLRAISAEALNCGLSLSDIAVICAISAAAVNEGRNAAKRALKFTEPNYDRQDAFNAMADLRSLKLFAALLGLLPNEPPALCTCDKDLALVWCGLNLTHCEIGDGLSHAKAKPLPQFLPQAAWLIYQNQVDNQFQVF